MKYRRTIPLLLAFAATAATAQTTQTTAPAAKPAAPAESLSYHRVDLKPVEGSGEPLPYTIEIPRDWQLRQSKDAPGLWLGPADAKIPDDPRLVWVRLNPKPMGAPEEVVASIKASDEKAPWSAPRVEVKELAGVRGVLVRMDSAEGTEARSTLALKVPMDPYGLDFLISAARPEFEKRLPEYERILLSVRAVKK